MRFTSFCSSSSLPDNSIIVFWSSMNFFWVNSSKAEFWNFCNSRCFTRSCWWTSRNSCCCRSNSSWRTLRSCSAWAARSSWWRTFSLYSAIIVLRCSLRCSLNIVLICVLELSRSSAILSWTDPPVWQIILSGWGTTGNWLWALFKFRVSQENWSLLLRISTGFPVLSTTTARYFARLVVVDIRIVEGSVVVEGVLPVDIAGSREVELFSVHEVHVLLGLITCEGCLVVRSGHGPQAEVAQGGWTWTSRGTLRKTSRRAGRRAVERSRGRRRVKRKQPQRNTQVHMHGWDDACKADLSHGAMWTVRINGRRAVCSVLRVVRVHVRDVVHVVHPHLAQGRCCRSHYHAGRNVYLLNSEE